jgi:hypothetical protein
VSSPRWGPSVATMLDFFEPALSEYKQRGERAYSAELERVWGRRLNDCIQDSWN